MKYLLDEHSDAIWGLLYPYIADENGPTYGEIEMEKLCTDVLPKVWSIVINAQEHLCELEPPVPTFDIEPDAE